MMDYDEYDELMMAAMAGNGCTECLATTHVASDCKANQWASDQFLTELRSLMDFPVEGVWRAAQDLWVALGEPPLPRKVITGLSNSGGWEND